MRLSAFCCAGLLLAAAGLARAQSDVPPAPGYQPSTPAAPAVQSQAVPYAPAAPIHTFIRGKSTIRLVPPTPRDYSPYNAGAFIYKPKVQRPPIGKSEHLKKAADHLEAAGLKEEAKRIRAQAAMIEHQGLLKQKLKELQKLQQEIQRLQKAVGTQQVRVDVKFIEVALDKLRDAGITLAEFSTLKHGSCPADKDDSNNGNTVTQTGATEGTTANPKDCAAAVQIIDEHGQITKIALELHKKGILKVIASPTLVTLPGRPATVRIGGEFPIIVPQGPEKNTIEYREFGIRMEAVPTIMANGKIRLELSSETAERDFKNTVVTNGIKVPGLNIRRVNTQIETESGKTVVIGGMVTATKTTDADDKTTKRETGLIIVVTPTLISGDSAIQPVSHEIHPQPLPNLSLPPAPIDLPAPPSLRLDGRTLFGPIKIELSLPPLKAEPKPEPELKPESSGPVKFRR